MKNKISTSDKNAGTPSDYRQAIAELIWNGFDAKVTPTHHHYHLIK